MATNEGQTEEEWEVKKKKNKSFLVDQITEFPNITLIVEV